MLMILCAIVVTAVVAGGLLWYGSEHLSFFPLMTGVFLLIATGVTSVFYAGAGWSWLAAEHKMHIINREYGTTYTRDEIFYASDVIDTIKHLDRSRYEINGNLMNGGGDR